MGRKKKPAENSPEYGTFILSLLFNSIELFVFDSKKPPLAQSMEKLESDLSFMFQPPEVKEAIKNYVNGLKELSPTEWEAETFTYTQNCKKKLLTLYAALAQPYPGSDLPPKEFASKWLKDRWGLGGTFVQQAAAWKQLIIDTFEKMVTGSLSRDFLSQELWGTFQNDPEKVSMIIRLMLQLESDSLTKQVDKAVKMLRDKLHSSVEFKAAVAFAEKTYQLGRDNTSQQLNELWLEKKSRIVGRIKGLDLRFPDAYETDGNNRKTWSEEEEFAISSVYHILLERAFEKPFQLVLDTINKTLTSFLVTAVVNDFFDDIRGKKKHWSDLIDRSVDVHNGDSEQLIDVLTPISPPEPPDQVANKEFWYEIMKKLTQTEWRIVELRVKGYPVDGIGRKLGKSHGWVEDRLMRIRRKLRPPEQN